MREFAFTITDERAADHLMDAVIDRLVTLRADRFVSRHVEDGTLRTDRSRHRHPSHSNQQVDRGTGRTQRIYCLRTDFETEKVINSTPSK